MAASTRAMAPRRYWFSTAVTMLLLCTLSVIMVLFLIVWNEIPNANHTLWKNWDAVSFWNFHAHFDGAWLIFILALGLFTPFLELITWIPVPALPAWLTGRRSLLRTATPPIPPSNQNGAGGGGIGNSGDKSTLAAPPLPGNTTWRRFVPPWVLNLSTGAMVFLFLWICVQVLSMMLPYGYGFAHLAEDDLYWLAFPMYGSDANYATRVIYGIGICAGWPCILCLAMVMIPVDRSSSWLAALNMSLEEANFFHRMFGWGYVFWASVHGILCHAAWFACGRKQWVYFMLPNKYYNWHFDMMAASISWFIVIYITITSLAWCRKHFYNLFRLSHLLIWPMFPLAIMHVSFMYFWVSYAFMLYAADLSQRWVLNSCHAGAVLTMPEAGVVKITMRLTRRHMRPQPDWAGKMVYVRIGRISFWETHPLSIASVDGDTVTLLLGVAGNWTNQLYQLAAGAGPGGIEVTANVEGPYGSDLTREMAEQDAVVLVAGGLGITPMAALLKQLLERPLLGTSGRRVAVHVLWVMRKATTATILPYNLLPWAINTPGVSVRLNVTDTPALEHAAIDSVSSASDEQLKKPAHMAVPVRMLTAEVNHALQSPFRAFLLRFVAKTFIVWVAALATTAGWVLASQFAYTYDEAVITFDGAWINEAKGAALEAAYNASTLSNYYRELNGLPREAALPSGAQAEIDQLAWPAGQPVFADFRPSIFKQRLFREMNWCLGCSDYVPWPEDFTYGMGPDLKCCTTRVAVGVIFIQVLFPFLFTLLMSVPAAFAAKHALARWWPLHPGTAGDSSLSQEGVSPQPSLQAGLTVDADPAPGQHVSSAKLEKEGGTHSSEPGKNWQSADSGGAGHVAAMSWRHGRPNFGSDLAEIAMGVTAMGGQRVAVYCCGPLGVRDAVRKAVYHNDGLLGCRVHLREFLFD